MNANAVPRDVKSAVLILRSTLCLAPIVDILSAKSMKIKIVIYSKCTKGECKCHDFLPSFSPWRPFAVQNDLGNFLLSFLVADQIEGQKKDVQLFAVLLVTFCRPKLKKGRQMVMQLFLSSERLPKRHQKVAGLILSSDWSGTFLWTSKGSLLKNDSKKS